MQKNYQSIILLLLSLITCALAQGLTIIAVPWYFTDELNLSSKFSLGYGIITLLGLIWGLYAGVIIDNFNRKKILLYINIFSAFIFSIIGVSEFIFKTPSSILIFLGFTTCSFYYMIFFPNLYALAQELTHKKEYIKINSFIEIFFQTTSIISAIMCGLLLSGSNAILKDFNFTIWAFNRWSIGEIFLLNGILYFITFMLLRFINYNHKKSENLPKMISIFEELKIAVIFLKEKKSILIYGICSQIIFAFLIVELFTLLPLFVKNCLNESIIIFSFADLTYGIGAIIAGILTLQVLKHVNKISWTIFLIIISAYAFITMVMFLDLRIFFFTTLIIGITNASTRITRMTYFFEKVPNYLIGRINTIFNSINTLIRAILILIFSISWFEEGNHVIIGYKIGVCVLIIFTIPLILEIRRN